ARGQTAVGHRLLHLGWRPEQPQQAVDAAAGYAELGAQVVAEVTPRQSTALLVGTPGPELLEPLQPAGLLDRVQLAAAEVVLEQGLLGRVLALALEVVTDDGVDGVPAERLGGQDPLVPLEDRAVRQYFNRLVALEHALGQPAHLLLRQVLEVLRLLGVG